MRKLKKKSHGNNKNPHVSHQMFGLVGLVLWHIKHYWLFNAKFCFYIYIQYMICKHILLIHTVKWPNSSISNDSIQHKSTKLNGSRYCYVSPTIQLNIIHLFTQLNDLTDISKTIQFSISYLIVLRLNAK